MNDPKLSTADLDQLGLAIVALTQELWVLKDRQRVLEATLESAGVIAPGDIDQHQPDTELTKLLQQERHQLVSNVLKTLQGNTD